MIYLGCTRKLESRLVVEAEQHNIRIDHQDLLSIQYRHRTKEIENLLDQDSPWVFTSTHALRAIQEMNEKYNFFGRSRKRHQHQAFCIAGKTENLARRNGFEILGTAVDSESLAQIILERRHEKMVTHPGSNLELTQWKEMLMNNGIIVNSIQVYEKTPDPKPIRHDHGMMFFSPSQIAAFFQRNQLDAHLPAFCIGNTTASMLKQYHHKNIIVSERSSAEQMLQHIFTYFELY